MKLVAIAKKTVGILKREPLTRQKECSQGAGKIINYISSFMWVEGHYSGKYAT